jgi:hypothetical protein
VVALVVFVIDHFKLAIRQVVRLLKGQRVQRIIDMRTIPPLRHNPQFNRDQLSPAFRPVAADAGDWPEPSTGRPIQKR